MTALEFRKRTIFAQPGLPKTVETALRKGRVWRDPNLRAYLDAHGWEFLDTYDDPVSGNEIRHVARSRTSGKVFAVWGEEVRELRTDS